MKGATGYQLHVWYAEHVAAYLLSLSPLVSSLSLSTTFVSFPQMKIPVNIVFLWNLDHLKSVVSFFFIPILYSITSYAGAQTAWDMLHEEDLSRRITTSCADLDKILGGGIACKEVTEIG